MLFRSLATLIDDPETKIKLFQKAIDIDNNLWAYVNLIYFLLSGDKIDEAAVFLSQAEHLGFSQGSHVEPLIRCELKKIRRSIETKKLALPKRGSKTFFSDLKKATKLIMESDFIESYSIVSLASLIDDVDFKIRLCDRAITQDHHPWAYSLKIKALLNNQNLEKAEATLQHWTANFHNSNWVNSSDAHIQLVEMKRLVDLAKQIAATSNHSQIETFHCPEERFLNTSKNILFFSPEAPTFDRSSGDRKTHV